MKKNFIITVDTEGDNQWNIYNGQDITTENANFIPRFQEMCEMLGVKKEEASEKEFMDYITWGVMPQRFYFKTEEETKVFMTDLYDSIVLKDIFWRGQVRDVDALNRLLEYIVLNSSQTFSPTSIAKYFESVNRKVAPDTIIIIWKR